MVTRYQPAPPATAPLPRAVPPAPRRRTGMALGVGMAALSVFGAAIGGVAVGAHLNTNTVTAAPAPTAAAPTAEQVRAATVDLCTRYATGYTAIPDSPSTAADVLPTLTYIGAALADNPAADPQIRAAVADSLTLDRGQAAHLSRTPAVGAIQPPAQWRGLEANAASEHVWGLCRAYGG